MLPCLSSMNSEDLMNDFFLCFLIFCSPSRIFILRKNILLSLLNFEFPAFVPYSGEVWICSKEITWAIMRHLPCFLWIFYPEGKENSVYWNPSSVFFGKPDISIRAYQWSSVLWLHLSVSSQLRSHTLESYCVILIVLTYEYLGPSHWAFACLSPLPCDRRN